MARVLIIDKDEQAREMLAWYLGLEDHDVEQAGTANEALISLAHTTPDVIITEVVLPDMSGHQLIGYLRVEGIAAEASIVVVTECRDTSWMIRSWELGAVAHLTRPVGPEEIADVVARTVPAKQVALTA